MEKPDCKINGWILDGCPTNYDQIQAMKELGINPQLVITMEVNDGMIEDRIKQRRFDPVDGRFYFINSCPLPSEIVERCIKDPLDEPKLVEKRL